MLLCTGEPSKIEKNRKQNRNQYSRRKKTSDWTIYSANQVLKMWLCWLLLVLKSCFWCGLNGSTTSKEDLTCHSLLYGKRHLSLFQYLELLRSACESRVQIGHVFAAIYNTIYLMQCVISVTVYSHTHYSHWLPISVWVRCCLPHLVYYCWLLLNNFSEFHDFFYVGGFRLPTL